METQTKYEIIQIVSQIMNSNCYLINYENKAIIIDTCVDVKTLKKYNVQEVEAVLLTHSHVDHIYYLEEITKEFNPIVYLFSEGLDMIYDDDLNLSIYFLAFPLLKWKLHEAKNCVCFGHMRDSEPGT